MEFKLNRFLMKKKIFSLILVASILIGLLPTPVSALATGLQIQPGSIDADPVTNPPAKLKDGQIWTDKSVVPVNNTGEFKITLSAAGQNYQITIPGERQKLDVVLVLDVSGSMDSYNRLSNMKTAASNAVNALLAPELDNRVALISYSSTALLKVDFTNSKVTLLNEINKLSADGGTNIQNAFLKAQQALENRSDKSRQPVIILMSDGAPTYYYTSLEDHSNRQGNGQNTTRNEVWWTIKQAAKAKSEIPDLRIYTIGFGVGRSDAAIATLMPDATNTDSYRPSGYYGFYRKVTESGQYYWYRTKLISWGDWSLVKPIDTYKRPLSTTYGAWIPFDGRSSQPQNQMGDPNKTGSAINPTDPEYIGLVTQIQYAYFAGVRTGTEYQVNGNGKVPFSDVYKYWEDGSSITSDGAQTIINAFTQIVNQLIHSKPVKYDQGSYTDITIEDELGEGFEVVGSLPEGVKKVGNKIIWTIDGDDFDTMEAGSQELTKIHKVTFNVKIRDGANVAKEYYTNAKAEAKFNVSSDNQYYKDSSNTGFTKDSQGNVTVDLRNNGWLTLEPIPPTQVKVKITKVVEGPIIGNHTFTFDIYGPDRTRLTDENGVTITVNGENKSDSVEALVQIPYYMYKNGTATLSVEERVPSPVPEYWTYDTPKTAVFEQGNVNETKTVTFTNTYAPKGTLTVIKQWAGDGPTSDVTFELQKKVNENNWEKVGESYNTIPKGSTTGVSISDLELDVAYRVVETSIADYTPGYSPEYVVFTPDSLEQTITITNTYQQPVYKITVNKVWNDANNAANDRPTSIQFKVLDSTGTQIDTLKIQPDTPDTNGKWSGVYETKAAGTYAFEEIVPKDYVVDDQTKSATVTYGEHEASVTFTNTYVEPKATLEIKKVWEGENGDLRFRPDDITVNVYKDNAEEPFASVILEASEGWKKKLTELDFGTYSVEEVSVSDYTTGYTSNPVTLVKDGERNGTIVITNNFRNPTGEITVNKTWADKGAEAIRPESINVTLTNGALSLTAELSDDNGWTYTFTNLPLSGTYTVTESDEDGKLASYVLSGNTSVTLDNNTRKGTISLTNTYAKGTITVTKEWLDKNNPDAEQPQVARITLMKEVITTSDAVTLEVGTVDIIRPNLSHTFYDLELSDSEKTVRYFVKELDIPFYEVLIENNSVVLSDSNPNGSFTVTNTYTDPKGSLTVYKTWNHGYNPVEKYPTDVTVELYKNGNYQEEATFADSYIFENLELGAEYTVKEVAVSNYSTSYSSTEPYIPSKDNLEGSITITNTYIPETGVIKVSKVWEGGGPKADEITVTLSRSYGEVTDKDFIRTLTLNDENGWTDTVTGLHLYGPGGVSYRYSATEQAFENSVLYRVENLTTPTLSKGETAEITIKNIYTPEVGTLVISKVWEGDDYTPEAIEVRLIVNGKPEDTTLVLSSENSWTVKLTNLNVNNTYSVVEVDPAEEYEVSYSSDNITFSTENLEQEIVITNTRTEDMPELVIEKTAMTPSITLVGGRGTFNYQLKITNSGNRTLRNVSVVDEMDLEGVDYIYPSDWKKLSDNVFEKYVADSMAPGETLYINYTVNVNRAGTYNNTATVTGYYMGRYIEEPMTFAAFARMAVAEPEFDPELGQKVTAFDSATATANTPSNPPSEQTQGTVIVKYVDQDGDEISASYQFSGVVGTNYVTAPRDIPGYTLIGTPDNASGSFIDGTITVLYVYKADNEPEEEVPEEPVEIEEEETPGGTPEEEPFLDEEVPFGGDILPQTGLPVVTLPQLFGGALIALGLYFGRKPKKEDEE